MVQIAAELHHFFFLFLPVRSDLKCDALDQPVLPDALHCEVSVQTGCLLVDCHPSNMFVYLRDRSAQTSVCAATQ